MRIKAKTIYISIIILALGLVASLVYKSIKDASAAQSDALNFYCKADQDFVTTVVQDWQETVAAFAANLGSGGPIDPGGGGPPESPYIGVTKTASPAGPFQNSQLPFSVGYTVTISAKQGKLTNVQIQYECKVTREGPSIPCPGLSNSIPTPPAEIVVGSPFTFRYNQRYTTAFQNSFIMDTIKVNATLSGVGNPTASTSLSIIIGAPPTGCFVLDSSWTAVPNYKANMERAIAYLVANMPAYATKICSGGTIDLRYNPAGLNGYWGYYHGSYVDFFNLGLGTEYNAKYTLIHEACHVLMGRMPSLYQQYLNQRIGEIPRCFYSYRADYYEERLCEAVTFGSIPCVHDPNFNSNYPLHRQFVESYIY